MNSSYKSASDRHLWEFPAVRDLFWIGLGIAVIVVGFHLRAVLTPALIALAIAYLIDPLVSFAAARFHLPRSITILSLFAVGFVLAGTFILLLGPLAVTQIGELSERLPGYIEQTARTTGYDHENLRQDAEQFQQQVREQPFSTLKPLTTGLMLATATAVEMMSTVAWYGLSALLIPVYTFFFSWQFESVLKGTQNRIPPTQREVLVPLFRRFDEIFGRFVRGRLIISLLQAVLFSAGYWAIEMPYWFLLGMISGALCFLPLIGIVGWPLALGIRYLDAVAGVTPETDWIGLLIWPTVVYGAVQLFEGWVLTPWIQGRELQMSPVAVLLLVFAGGSIGGVFGVLLAVPLAACGRVIIDDVLQPRLESWASPD